jgi:purine nucleosidase
MRRYYNKNGEFACPMHDPLTVLYVIDQTLIDMENHAVQVETSSTYADGMTICDFDEHWNQKPNVYTGLTVDVDRFRTLMIQLINAL